MHLHTPSSSILIHFYILSHLIIYLIRSGHLYIGRSYPYIIIISLCTLALSEPAICSGLRQRLTQAISQLSHIQCNSLLKRTHNMVMMITGKRRRSNTLQKKIRTIETYKCIIVILIWSQAGSMLCDVDKRHPESIQWDCWVIGSWDMMRWKGKKRQWMSEWDDCHRWQIDSWVVDSWEMMRWKGNKRQRMDVQQQSRITNPKSETQHNAEVHK